MEIVNYFLPENPNNPVSYCAYKAKQCAGAAPSWRDAHINVFAARFFAALTPLASLGYAGYCIGKGLYQASLLVLKPEWAEEHFNCYEELKMGLRALALSVAMAAYAVLAIVAGTQIINRIKIPTHFRYTYKVNIKKCQQFAKADGSFHITMHNGIFAQRPSPPSNFSRRELKRETIELLFETYLIALKRGKSEEIQAVMATVQKTDSDSMDKDWIELRSLTSSNPKSFSAATLDTVFQEILEGKNVTPQIFPKTEVEDFLGQKYPRITVEQVIPFYTQEDFIPSRVLHAIIIGIQANLTGDISLEELDALRKPLAAPNCYYTDFHYVQLSKDIHCLDLLSFYKSFEPLPNDESYLKKFRDYGYAEYLARSIVYGMPQQDRWHVDITDTRSEQYVKGTLFTCYREGKPTLMKVMDSLSLPGLTMIEVISQCGTFGATIFRGTSGWGSFKRDFEVAGVGRSSFEAYQEKLIEQFLKHPKPKCWDITGHSLGGCDAQRFLYALLKKKVALPETITLSTFNSPKLEHDIAQDFLIVAGDCSSEIIIRHTRVLGDIIQIPGKILLGFGGDAPPNLEVTKLLILIPPYDYLKTFTSLHLHPLYAPREKPDGKINLNTPIWLNSNRVTHDFIPSNASRARSSLS